MIEFLKQAWFWLRPTLGLILDAAGPVLASAAVEVVRELMDTEMDGGDRREVAQYEIKQRLRRAGAEATERAINAAIEAAVIQIKGR